MTLCDDGLLQVSILTYADNGVSSAHEVGEFLEEIAGNIENMTGLVT